MATPSRRHRWLASAEHGVPEAGRELYALELEEEVRHWLANCSDAEYALAQTLAGLLAQRGPAMIRNAKQAKGLENGVFELRVDAHRITYWFPADRHAIVLLTVFRKQRDNDRGQKDRAYGVKKMCAEHHRAGGEHDVFTRTRKGGAR
ncbi:type II toxin-antitoxin system RelE/ParE family toxin [Kitasatospora sp. NPDC059160]|uniref:type II toxin-antitoxin system RelE/ParE family toxin n=1 Tax=Kitasatospora sp. NPDC059160 TaxID=3346748 RepID=UPI00369E4E62